MRAAIAVRVLETAAYAFKYLQCLQAQHRPMISRVEDVCQRGAFRYFGSGSRRSRSHMQAVNRRWNVCSGVRRPLPGRCVAWGHGCCRLADAVQPWLPIQARMT
jgi:hypothetical protein